MIFSSFPLLLPSSYKSFTNCSQLLPYQPARKLILSSNTHTHTHTHTHARTHRYTHTCARTHTFLGPRKIVEQAPPNTGHWLAWHNFFLSFFSWYISLIFFSYSVTCSAPYLRISTTRTVTFRETYEVNSSIGVECSSEDWILPTAHRRLICTRNGTWDPKPIFCEPKGEWFPSVGLFLIFLFVSFSWTGHFKRKVLSYCFSFVIFTSE